MSNSPVTDGAASEHTAVFPERLSVGDVILDRAAHVVTVNGRPCLLARQEFRLLEMLMRSADRVLSPRTLLDALWGPDYMGDSLAVHMLRLRRKLERQPGGTRHLRTVRGVGYVFDTVPI